MAKSQKISADLSGGGNTITPPNKVKRCRTWCFTLNNWIEEEKSQILNNFKDETYILGFEVGEKGTPHIQGYVRFKNQKEFKVVKNLIGDRAHIEPARGSDKENIKYCSKDGDFKNTFPMPINDRLLLKYKDTV